MLRSRPLAPKRFFLANVARESLTALMLLGLGLASGTLRAAPAADDEDKKITVFFEQSYRTHLNFFPQTKTRLGLKDDQDKLDDPSEAHAERVHRYWQEATVALRRFNYQRLSADNQLNYDLFAYMAAMALEGHEFRLHHYLIEPLEGAHTALPVFLANSHRIETLADAQAYVTRLRAFGPYFKALGSRLQLQVQAGIVMPLFVYKAILSDITSMLASYPFTGDEKKEHSPLWSDFNRKLAKVSAVSPAQKTELLRAAREAINHDVAAAYRELAALLTRHASKASDDTPGVWSLPQGDRFYDYALRYHTSTKLTADEIHDLGRREVARIHREMEAIKIKLGFKGSLKEFFVHTENRQEGYCPNTDAGREACLAFSKGVITRMQAKLPELVSLALVDQLEVRPVESFRAKTAGFAFYEQPAADHSRPGVYYVNLSDTSQVPLFEMEALAHHEGLPGHHLQISIAQSIPAPRFRQFYWSTAFGEGWGLYAEYFPKELGFYQDPYSDFGRLSMELWRATRLVVDTGLHAKRWTKAEAFAYLREETPASEGKIIGEAERYMVWPGQATAYKVGMAKILELRSRAQTALGKDFNLRQFHNQILSGGTLPLLLLEKRFEQWLQATSKKG